MARTGGYSKTVIARRVVARTFHHVVRKPLLLVALAFLGALLVLGVPGLVFSDQGPTAAQADDAAELYMRGLRDHDVADVLASLSPEMRRSLEQRTGQVGPAAVAALFQEQERQGERTVGYHLVGSYSTVQGDEIRFYIVRVQRGTERRDIPYMLTLGPDGTITKIE